MEASEGAGRITIPGGSQTASEIFFLGNQVLSAIAETPRLNQDHLGRIGKQISQKSLFGDHPGQEGFHPIKGGPVSEPLPVFAAPGFLRNERGGPLAEFIGHDQFAGWPNFYIGEIFNGPLITHAEAGESIYLIAPQIHADWGIGSGGVHIDDGTAPRKFTPVFNEFLAPIAMAREFSHEMFRVHAVACGDADRGDLGNPRCELLE